jgi:predicted RNase H-like nuclease
MSSGSRRSFSSCGSSLECSRGGWSGRTATIRVAGIDGCKKGWIAVLLEGRTVVEVIVFENFDAVVARLGGVPYIGIDIPLGLSETGDRQADVLARKRLGSRGGAVFRVPPRRILEAADYDMAKGLAKAGKRPSRQLWGIRQKILQVNDHPGLDSRFCEVHPEISFREMAGEPLPSKKSWNGLWRRVDLLAREGIELPKNLVNDAGEAGPDDVLDAAAAAWTALRKSEGRAIPRPDPPEMLGDREAAIWF